MTQKKLRHIAFICLLAIGFLYLGQSAVAWLWGLKTTNSPVIEDNSPSVSLQPHKALYEISLAKLHNGSQLTDIRGQMFFEWMKTCEGWSTDHRSNLTYKYSSGEAIRVTSDFTTFETENPTDLTFNSLRTREGETFEEFQGHAVKAQKDISEASFSKPSQIRFDLPEETLFPMEHTKELIRRAKNGEKFFTATIFDGSDDQGPQKVTAFITKFDTGTMMSDPNVVDQSLLGGDAWKIRLAFFSNAEENENDLLADYEMDLISYDNGIVRDITIQYDDFTLIQRLTALEPIDAEKCSP